MNVVFVAPFLLEATVRFVDAVSRVPDVVLGIVSQDPEDHLPEALRHRMAAHYRIDDGIDTDQITSAVRLMQRHLGGVDRVIGTLEQLQVPLAEVRSRLDIDGMPPDVARNFRDKAQMKTVLREHAVPCADHALASTAEEALHAADRLGFPFVVKPPAGAGARSTFRIEDAAQMRTWLQVDAPSAANPALLEQVLYGQEHSFDSVMVGGKLIWYSISRYLPAPLEVLENPWIQWAVLLPREIGGSGYEVAADTATRALDVLGMHTGLSHMEWFLRSAGDVAISEVAARPPGAQFMTLMSYSHDIDMYAAWAHLEVHHTFDPPERRYAAGAAYLRAQGTGRIRGTGGLDVLQAELGDLVVEARLPRHGEEASGTYEGEGYVIVRDAETTVVEAALRRIVDVARVLVAQS